MFYFWNIFYNYNSRVQIPLICISFDSKFYLNFNEIQILGIFHHRLRKNLKNAILELSFRSITTMSHIYDSQLWNFEKMSLFNKMSHNYDSLKFSVSMTHAAMRHAWLITNTKQWIISAVKMMHVYESLTVKIWVNHNYDSLCWIKAFS